MKKNIWSKLFKILIQEILKIDYYVVQHTFSWYCIKFDHMKNTLQTHKIVQHMYNLLFINILLYYILHIDVYKNIMCICIILLQYRTSQYVKPHMDWYYYTTMKRVYHINIKWDILLQKVPYINLLNNHLHQINTHPNTLLCSFSTFIP